MLDIFRRGEEPEQRQGDDENDGAGGAGLRTIALTGERGRALRGGGDQGGKLAQAADRKSEDRSLKEIPAEVKAEGEPERAGADAGEGEKNSDGDGVEESPA